MPVVKWEKEKSVAVVKMCNGANRQNPDFMKDIHICLDQILSDPDITALILTSPDSKNFSQGIDTDWLAAHLTEKKTDIVRTFLYDMNDLFKRLLTFPIPIVAAINGHAFGNGALLACACDFRLMNQAKGFFCFPEVDISIPFLPGMIELSRKAIPEHLFNEMVLTGNRLGAQRLEKNHVIVTASENEEKLMEDAMAFAEGFDKKRAIFSELKKRMHKQIIKTMDTADKTYIESLNLFV